MKRFLGVTLAAIVAGIGAVGSGAASGDDIATLKAQLTAANATVHSMRMELKVSPIVMSVTMTIERNPARFHMVTSGPIALDMYVAGGFLYQQTGRTWRKHPTPVPTSMLEIVPQFSDAAHVTLSADVIEDGVRYGAFDAQTEAEGLGMLMPATRYVTCAYDKATFLVHDCKNDLLTETFSYNNPAATVVLPTDVANAVDGDAVPLPGFMSPQAPQPASGSSTAH